MKRIDPQRALGAGAAAVTIALTAAAFWLSYEHLHDVAAANGLHDAARAWAWPATVDLFIVAGELLFLRASLAGRVDRCAIGLTATGSIGSIALNVSGVGAHAQPLEYVVAAVPPVAALLAFGALMRQVHEHLADRVDAHPVRTPNAPASGNASVPGQPATAPAGTTAPKPAGTAVGTPRARGAGTARNAAPKPVPGAARNTRPRKSDEVVVEELAVLRIGATEPLSLRFACDQIGVGADRLKALLSREGVSLDPLPEARRPLHVVHADDGAELVSAAPGGGQ